MRFHGLFIGIDKYFSPLINELSCAARDARALYALFADNLGEDGAVLLCDDRATREAILNDFLSRLSTVEQDELVVIAFSGHGSDDHYLVTHNADPLDFKNTAIELDELVDLFGRIPARNVLLILDCCFSGGAGARVFHRDISLRSPATVDAILQQVSGRGRVVFTACGPDEEAIEDQKKGHGLLTYYLLEALRGAPEVVSSGKVGLYQILHYVTQRVTDVASSFRHKQQPAFRGVIDGEVTFPVFNPGPKFKEFFPDRVRPRVSSNVDDLVAYGLPKEIVDVWRGSIPGLNELQQEAINEYGLLDGEHILVSAPTSSGKTVIGELAALRSYFDRKRSLFLLPLKALVNDKHSEFLRKYGEFGLRIIRATGDHSDDIPDLLRGRYDLCLMTYEKFTNLALMSPYLLRQVGLVVVDEVQMLADRNRGSNLEFLLTLLKVRRYEGLEPQIIALSAVIGDSNGLERWLGARLLRTETRPVPLMEGILKTDGNFRFLDEDGTERTVPYIVSEHRRGSSQDYIIPLVRRLTRDREKVLVFRTTKGLTRGTAGYLSSSLGLPAAEEVIAALPAGDPSAASGTLRQCLAGGVAFHNSDLDREERAVIEEAFRDSESPLRVLVATTTVAMGVNTPAFSVIIAGLDHPDGPYSVAEYKNMVGRAGRLGYTDHGKSFVITSGTAEEISIWNTYVRGRPEDLFSRFAEADLLSLVTRVLATVQAAHAGSMSEEDIVDFLENSFAAFQLMQHSGAQHWDSPTIQRAIQQLKQYGLIAEVEHGYCLTALGRLSGENGVAVTSIIRLVAAFRNIPVDRFTDAAILVAVQGTLELDDILFPVHKTSHQERQTWRRAIQNYDVPAQVLNALYNSARDEVHYTVRCKRAVSVLMWIQGTELQVMEGTLLRHQRDQDAAGAIRVVADRTRDLFPIAARVAEIMNTGQLDFGAQIEELLVRLEFGIPRELVPLARVAGNRLLRGDYLALKRSGILAAGNIAAKTDDELKTILHDDRKVSVLRWVQKVLIQEAENNVHK